MICNSRYKCIK